MKNQKTPYNVQIFLRKVPNTGLLALKIGLWYWYASGIWKNRICFETLNSNDAHGWVQADKDYYMIGGALVGLNNRFLCMLRKAIADQVGDFADPFGNHKIMVKFRAKKRPTKHV